MLNRDCIGTVSEERVIDVEKGQVRLFAKAIGETNPIHFDDEAAKAAGYRGIVAPATFASCLRLLAPAKIPTNEQMGIDYKKILNAEEDCQYEKIICAGDRLTLVTEVVDIYDKKGGALEFLVRETKITNEAGELVFSVVNKLVSRNG